MKWNSRNSRINIPFIRLEPFSSFQRWMLNMSKQKMLIEYIIRDIVRYIMQEKNVPVKEAMRLFYNSQTFEKLNDEETGLYFESSAYVYDIYKTEEKFGKIVQMEI